MSPLSKVFSIALISCLGIIVYSDSFHCPFQYDDKIYIIDNLAIRNISDLRHIWEFVPCRFLTFFSLALNYHFHQLHVFGYHLVNLAVHLISAVLVWWLTLLTSSNCLIALFAGLVFVSHPLQTEAVTYIWQRTASLATMFYLASLCFYVRSRLLQDTSVTASPSSGVIARSEATKQSFYYIASLLTAVAAMFTKETAITLPLMLVLYEFYFLDRHSRPETIRHSEPETIRHSEPEGRRISTMTIPFFFIALIIPLTLLLTASVNAHPMRGTAPEQPSSISTAHYLLTQFRVMVTYVRLVFLPFHQDLDYDYRVFKNIFEAPVFVSFLFLITVLYWAKRLFSKYRLVSFSIFWFFLTLLPESSFLPLQDVIVEHRLYLPLVGFSMFLASGAYYIFIYRHSDPETIRHSEPETIRHSEPEGRRILNKRLTMVKVMILIITCYSVLTYQRNEVWKDEFTLWDDTVRKSPHKARPYNNRGLALARRGNLAAAIADYGRAIEIDPGYLNPYVNRGFLYNKEGDFTRALSDYNRAIGLNPKLAAAYINRGNVYGQQGRFAKSLSDFNEAIKLNQNTAQAYNDRGNIYFKLGNFTQAIADYTRAVELKADYEDARYNLTVVRDIHARHR